MATQIGPKIGLEGEKEFCDALKHIVQVSKTLDSEMKALVSTFDDHTSAQEKAEKQGAVYAKQIENQKQRIAGLSDMLAKSAQQYGENDDRTLKWREQLNNATTALNKMERELSRNNEALEEAGNSAEKSEAKFSNLGGVLKSIGAAMGAVAAAAGTAAVALGKQVIEAFGELEQNLGGSEAVFGDYAAGIQKIAEDAYKNMGTSQSDYLATANKMGALFQGSGIEQQRSMELTTQAMQRAADMASVMGIDMSAALEAVTGAAKGNYTMMDNLGVAMNATTLDAYAMAKGIDTAWNSMSNAEKAELAMQYFFESTEQYAGNFARESTETISGSIGLMQAAVESWVAGLGNADADMQNLTGNMVDAFNAVVENVVPVIENIVKALPIATEGILQAIGELLPTLLETVTQLFTQILETILTLLPQLIPTAVEAIMTIVGALIDNLPLLIDAAVQLITALVEGVGSALPELIPVAVEAITTIVQGLIDNLPMLLVAALQLILGLAQGLLDALPQLIAATPQIIEGLVEGLLNALPQLIELGIEMNIAIATGLIEALPELVAMVPKIFKGVVDAFKKVDWASIGKSIMEGIGNGLRSMWSSLVSTVKEIAGDILDAAKNLLGIHSPSRVFEDEIGKMIPAGITLGVQDAMPKAIAQVREAMAGFEGLSVPAPRVAGSMLAQGATTNNSFGGVTIQVYGAPGQDVNRLAQIVMDKIESVVSRKGAVYA